MWLLCDPVSKEKSLLQELEVAFKVQVFSVFGKCIFWISEGILCSITIPASPSAGGASTWLPLTRVKPKCTKKLHPDPQSIPKSFLFWKTWPCIGFLHEST